LLEQPHVLDHDHGLIGEGRDEINLLLGEWVNGSARQKQGADRGSLSQQRNAKHVAIAPEPLALQHSELRIGQNVADLNHSAFKHDSSGDGAAIKVDWRSQMVVREFRRKAVARGKMQLVALQLYDRCTIRAAQSRRRRAQRVENRLKVKG